MGKFVQYLTIFLFIFPLYLFPDTIKIYNNERAQVEATIAMNPTNPFNPTTQIMFDLPQESKVTLEVFDINGHKVATVAKGNKPA